MRLTLPWPLRRFLLGALLCSVTMASAASGAEFVVDASQATVRERVPHASGIVLFRGAVFRGYRYPVQ